MDPFSALASIVGVADVAARASTTIWKVINEWRDAPAQLGELQEEIHASTDIFKELIATQLLKAKSAWTDLEGILNSVLPLPAAGRTRIRKDKWMTQKGKALRLQGVLKEVRSQILVALSLQGISHDLQANSTSLHRHDETIARLGSTSVHLTTLSTQIETLQ